MFGRHVELSALRTALDRVGGGGQQRVVVCGEPGIGKTTLLDEAVRFVSADSVVLRVTALENERHLPSSALGSLLGSVRNDVGRLHPPHGSVLRGAIETGAPAPPASLGLALLNLIDDLADRHDAVVIVIDDAQWVDELSSTALLFALRRLGERPVAVLAATRDVEWKPLQGATVVRLDGVDAATGQMILEAAGPIDAAVTARLRDACAGNPLALVHVGRVLTTAQRRGVDDLPEPVPLEGRLASVLARRLADLPGPTLVALGVLAASGAADAVDLCDALRSLGVSTADLAAAERADVVVDDRHGAIGFVHPLLRSATMTVIGPTAQRDAHRALAAVTSDTDRRAHHLDLAAEGPDHDAAHALEAVARLAGDAHAYERALQAWERAARRSTTRDDVARCLGEATQSAWNAGRLDRGIELGREAASMLSDGPARAAVLLAVGDMTFFHEDSAGGARILLDESASLADRDPAASATMLAMGANLLALTGDLARADRVVRRSVERARRSGDPVATMGCTAMATHIGLVHGQGEPDREEVDALVDLVGLIGDDTPRELTALGQLVVFDLLSLGRWTDAVELGGRVLVQARRHGLVGEEVFVHGLLGEVAFRRGRWIEARAESLIESGFNEARQQPTGSFGHATLARVDAAIGHLDESRRNATFAADHGRRTGIRVLEAWGLQALGLAALADGDPSGAVEVLTPVWELCRRGEIGAPGPLWWQGDLVEALWRSEQWADIRRLIAQLDEDAARTKSSWAAAVAARGRGLVHRAGDELLRSAALLDELHAPFEAARSRALLADIGVAADHRDAVHDAEVAFHRLGAVPWSARLSAVVGSASTDATALVSTLSRAELRVALLVGRGCTNREVADELFLSPRTVDSHLQRIYRKLGLRSRTELALLVAHELA